MERWEFLLQPQGDRAWHPLPPSPVEIEPGTYRLALQTDRPHAAIEVCAIYCPVADNGSARPRSQKHFCQADGEGFAIVIPPTKLKPGEWQICCRSDILSELLDEYWQQTLELQVAATQPTPELGRPDARLSEMLRREFGWDLHWSSNSLAQTSRGDSQSPNANGTPSEAIARRAAENGDFELETRGKNAPASQLSGREELPSEEEIESSDRSSTDVELEAGGENAPANQLFGEEELLSASVSEPSEEETESSDRSQSRSRGANVPLESEASAESEELPPELEDLSLERVDEDTNRTGIASSSRYLLPSSREESVELTISYDWEELDATESDRITEGSEPHPSVHSNRELLPPSDHPNREPRTANRELLPQLAPVEELRSRTIEAIERAIERAVEPLFPDRAPRLLRGSSSAETWQLTLDRETFIARSSEAIASGSTIFISGHIEAPGGDPSADGNKCLRVYLRDPQTGTLLLDVCPQSPQPTLPDAFSYPLQLPEEGETYLLIGEVALETADRTNEDGLREVLARQSFTVNLGCEDLRQQLRHPAADPELALPPKLKQSRPQTPRSPRLPELPNLPESGGSLEALRSRVGKLLDVETALNQTYSARSGSPQLPPADLTPEPRPLDGVPQPEIILADSDLRAGETAMVRIKLPLEADAVYVKLWLKDAQTRSLLDGPRALVDFVMNWAGELEAATRVSVPASASDLRFEAIAIDRRTHRESYKATVEKRAIAADLRAQH